jgi:hypothetical protein
MVQDQKKFVFPNLDGSATVSSDTTGDRSGPPSLSMSLSDAATDEPSKPGSTESGRATAPPPLPNLNSLPDTSNPETIVSEPSEIGDDHDGGDTEQDQAGHDQRRIARRRPAGPVRGTIAANDDAPSIGGLIYALEQKPGNQPYVAAAIASGVWAAAGLSFAAVMTWQDASAGAGFLEILARPSSFFILAAIVVPIAVLWFLALLAWRSEELRLRSSTMTEVAVRLAEPDRMAEQQVASLGQAVRRQVAFMNDAVSRALGRAGELEALVHNEVSALEGSYEENERKIRGLIQELSGERNALANTGDRVAGTLRQLGSEVPSLIEKLSHQQIRLAQIIEQAGDNLNNLEGSIGTNIDKLETSLGGRTEEFQMLLEGYTTGLAQALGDRNAQMRSSFDDYLSKIDTTLGDRTNTLQTVFEEYARALDTTLANRAQTLDTQLVERTKALDSAFNERLRLFDASIKQSTTAIDNAVEHRAAALTSALDNHARTFSETITQQSNELDESLTHGINSVRRTSENITRQSLKAIEDLNSQSEMLKSVSENLLDQITGVTNRYENQSQSIMKAANSLESANYKIDTTLQKRHADLSKTLEHLSGKADEFGQFIEGYSSTIEGSLDDAERKAREVTEKLLIGTERSRTAALADLDKLKRDTDAQRDQMTQQLRREFENVSRAVNEELGSLRGRVDAASDDVRKRAAEAANDIASEQVRLRNKLDQMPMATPEGAQAMRRALQDQVRALEHLSTLTSDTTRGHDVTRPHGKPQTQSSATSLTQSYEATTPGPRNPAPTGTAPAGVGNRWSFGDLLARASQDDEGTSQPPAAATARPEGSNFELNIRQMAGALDPATAASVWSRLRVGQQNVMSRGIYTPEGQALFDKLSNRLRTDVGLQNTVSRFLEDFRRIQQDSERKDPSGQLTKNQLLSETGRVYLFLAHASGRIS